MTLKLRQIAGVKDIFDQLDKSSISFIIRRYWVLISVMLVVFQNGNAQMKYKFEQLTVKDGLLSNRVSSIYRDSREYLWIGTENGLNRFDSRAFKSYVHDEKTPGTLSNNRVRYIFEDRNKNLWLGSADGLNLYNPLTETFKVFKAIPGDSNSLHSNFVSTIAEDSKGNLWVATGGNYINKWIPESETFIQFKIEDTKEKKEIPPNRTMAIDSKGDFWIAPLSRGIIRFNPETGNITKFDDANIDFGIDCFKSVYIDDQDNIWIASDGSGFFSFDPSANKFESFGSQGGGKGVNVPSVLDIIPENDRYLLLAVDQGGINRFDKVTKTFEYIVYSASNNETRLNNNGIWCLHRDREGILWVGTSGGGINYYNPKKRKFKLFKNELSNVNSLTYDFTGCFYQDHLDSIWIGTDGGGISIFDPETEDFRTLKHDPNNPNSLSGNVIRSIKEDKDRDVWVGTWDSGLNRYDRKKGRFYRYAPFKNDPGSISGVKIWDIAVDHNDILWLAIRNVGIDLFDKDKGVIKRFRVDPGDPNALSHQVVNCLYQDDENNMWACTQEGLNLYDPVSGSFKVYKFGGNYSFEAFLKAKNGNLWAGTAQDGLFLFDLDGTIIKKYTIEEGLPDNSIKAILEDENGKLWISTNNGICEFDPQTEKCRNYFEADGLQGDQFFQNSSLKARDGYLYFGGYSGFNTFHPDSLKDNEFIPPIYITDFKLFNNTVPVGVKNSPLKHAIGMTDKITLSWKESVISFDFVAINYTFPDKTQYQYLLEGFEEQWNKADALRSYTTYTNLDPGTYVFRVKAANNDGKWNKEGTSIELTITPPFWGTEWFIVGMIGLLAGLVYLFNYLRTRQLVRINIELETKVEARTTQLNQLVIELKEKQDEIETNNEELTATMEDLFEQKKRVDAVNIELEQAHEQLRQTNEQLDIRVQERTSKLLKANQELDRFVYSASHDLSSPLKSIMGLIHLTKIENKNKELLSYLEHMEKSVNKLENVIKTLTQFSRNLGQSVRRTTLQFDQVVNEVLNELEFSFDSKEYRIVKNYPVGALIKVDYLRMKILLNNLISNAIKYRNTTSENSEISIGLSNIAQGYEIKIGDNGIGIAKEHLDKIFGMFFRGTEQSGGSGLGLYIVKETVDRMKGTIDVESKLGEYTIFTIHLPG